MNKKWKGSVNIFPHVNAELPLRAHVLLVSREKFGGNVFTLMRLEELIKLWLCSVLVKYNSHMGEVALKKTLAAKRHFGVFQFYIEILSINLWKTVIVFKSVQITSNL